MKLTALSVSTEEEQYESAFQIHLFFLRSPLFWHHKLNISKEKLFFGYLIQNDFPAGWLGPNQAVIPWISGLVSSHQFSMLARFVMRYKASYAFALIVIRYILISFQFHRVSLEIPGKSRKPACFRRSNNQESSLAGHLALVGQTYTCLLTDCSLQVILTRIKILFP